MSKRIPAEITCAACKHKFKVSLYRTIWIEQPENRKLIFEDKINSFACPRCKRTEKLKYPFLCTNVEEHIAVWYEPYPDPAIDDDVKQYAAHMGATSFYATAPRIREWEAFKAKIIELEQRTGMKPGPKYSSDMQKKMRGFIDHIKREQAAAHASPALNRDRILFHLRIAMLAPAIFYLSGGLLWETTHSKFMAWAAGIAGCFFAWGILGRLIEWASSGAGIPVSSKDQKGIERLGLVCGIIAAPFGALWWYRFARHEYYSDEPAILLSLPAALASFLILKILIRTGFWIRDGFSGAP